MYISFKFVAWKKFDEKNALEKSYWKFVAMNNNFAIFGIFFFNTGF